MKWSWEIQTYLNISRLFKKNSFWKYRFLIIILSNTYKYTTYMYSNQELKKKTIFDIGTLAFCIENIAVTILNSF